MYIGLYHCGIQAHLAAPNQPLLLGQLYDPCVQLLHYSRPDRPRDLRQHLSIWYLLHPDTSEFAVDQIGPYFSLHSFEAPIPSVLQNQQPQYHFGWRLFPASLSTVFTPFPLRFVNRIQQRLIRQ
jgi:hypothetical protein